MKTEVLYNICVGALVLVFIALLLNCFMVKDYGTGTLVCLGFLVGYRICDPKNLLHEEQQIVDNVEHRKQSSLQ